MADMNEKTWEKIGCYHHSIVRESAANVMNMIKIFVGDYR